MFLKAANWMSYLSMSQAIIQLLNVAYGTHSPVLVGLFRLFWKGHPESHTLIWLILLLWSSSCGQSLGFSSMLSLFYVENIV